MKKYFTKLLAFIAMILMGIALVSCEPTDEPGGNGNNNGNNGNNNSENNEGDKKLELETVDLGLPSGLLWATSAVYDINARFDTERYKNRNYFSWGRVYSQSIYSTRLEDDVENISGNAKYDVATKLCGEGWRIPTKEEWEELLEHCTKEAEYHSPLTLTSKINGRTLILGAAGCMASYGHTSRGSGWYWTATSNGEREAYAFTFWQGLHSWEFDCSLVSIEKELGLTVHPVKDSK